MKNKFTSALLFGAVLIGATSASAQLALENFSSFVSPQTLFYGDWSSTGDLFIGSTTPAATFSQGSGFYNITGVSNADSSFVERSFTSSLNLGSNNQLALSLRLLSNNTADSLTVFLLDTSARTASVTFLTSDFNTAGFFERTLALTADVGFDTNQVSAFRISGNDPFNGGILSISLDNLAATGRAVPEPSTYGLIGAAALLIGIVSRTRRR